MYVVKRTVKTQPGKAWEVAGYLTKICGAYEKEQGRNEAQVYLGGQGLPGEQNVVYAPVDSGADRAYRSGRCSRGGER